MKGSGRARSLALILLLVLPSGGCTVEFARRATAADTLGWAVFPEAPAAGTVGGLPAGTLQAVLDAIADTGRAIPTATSGASGVTAAVITARGAWAGAAGVDGQGVALRPASRLDLGDLTMTVTAAEVLHLAALGRVDLDSPAAGAAPPDTAAGAAPSDTAAGAAPSGTEKGARPLPAATVREALGMRGGLADPTAEQYADLAARVRADPGRGWTRADAIALLPAGPPVPAPAYSTLGYLMLADIVERATGMPFWRAIQVDLLDPAGLPAMSADGAVSAPGPADPGLGGPAVPPVLPVTSGATGLAADADTLARWGWDLYGARLLPPAAVADMTTSAGPGRIGNRPYGLGTMIFSRTVASEDSFGHYGRADGYSSILVVEPRGQVAVAVLAIGGGKDLLDAAQHLFVALGG